MTLLEVFVVLLVVSVSIYLRQGYRAEKMLRRALGAIILGERAEELGQIPLALEEYHEAVAALRIALKSRFIKSLAEPHWEAVEDRLYAINGLLDATSYVAPSPLQLPTMQPPPLPALRPVWTA